MRLLKKISTFPFIVIGIIGFAVSLSFLIINQSSSQTNISNSICSGVLISVPGISGVTNNAILSGVTSVDVNVPTTSQQVGSIIITASSSTTAKRVIGKAQIASTGTNTSTWNFKWVTALWPLQNSAVNLSAELVYLGGNGSCTVESTNRYYIVNNQPTTITVTLVGQTEPVSVGSTNDYSVSSKIDNTALNTFDINLYSIIKWSTSSNIGVLSINPTSYPNDTQRTFNAGKEPGSNTVSANVIYGGADVSQSKTITVKPLETTPNNANSTTSTPGDTANDSLSAESPSESSESATITPPNSSSVQPNPVTKSCIEEALTTKRYTEINSGASRPTASELSKIATCFAPSKYILPSNFSPIDPVKVNDLKVGDNISVSNLENVTTKVDSKDKQTLKITGKTTPNTVVVIYIYSDPLVITTKSDSEGNWQYSIEDPLEPGKHEVYAIVDNGDGVYKRSDPMSFIISTASATATNPNGLSLNLSEPPKKTPTQSSTNLIIYVAGSIAVLVVALICLYMIFRSHHKHKVIIAQINKSAEIEKSSDKVTIDVKEVDNKIDPVDLKE